MTATTRRRGGTPGPGEVLLESAAHPVQDAPARRDAVRAAAADLRDAVAAEATAMGAQLRCIHRLWLAAQSGRTAAQFEVMTQAETDYAARGRVCPDPLGPLSEPQHQLVTDVAAEVGPALRLPAGTARRRVEDAVILAEDLPEVLTALEAGRIGWAQAAVLVEQWRDLITEAPSWEASVPPPVEAVVRLVAELLERAPQATAAQLRATARDRRRVLVAAAAERARRAARKRRAVWVEPGEDGTAYLHALLDAHVAVAVQARLEELVARLGQGTPGPDHLVSLPRPDAPEDTEDRSTGELRADVLADLLLDGILPEEPCFPRGVRAQVSVLVPAALLAAQNPAGSIPGAGAPRCGAAVLSGYGPISTEVARQLAAGAGAWHRILTHPVTGVVLDHDRTVYAVPADLRRLVELRDGTCRFPGCRRRAQACELDHTVAWAEGGPTAEHNLAALCPHHHRIKHRDGALGAWTVRRVLRPPGEAPPGSGVPSAALEWTSPGGIVHRTTPEHRLPADDPPPFTPVGMPAGDMAEDLAPDDPAEDPAPF